MSYKSRQRIYTELCNRSSSRSSGFSDRMPYSCDTYEDYWEDASVSLRSCHSWEPPSSPWLIGATASPCVEMNAGEENKRLSALGSHQSRPYRYTFDDNEYMAGSKGRRSFPPPLASCSTLSIKEGGRFVLKEMDADRPQGFFRAQRGNGRLRLQLVLPDEVLNEEDEHKESLSPVEDLTESKVDSLAEHDTHDEERTASNEVACSTCDEEGGSASFGSNEGLCGGGEVCAAESVVAGRHAVQDVDSESIESTVCSTLYDSEIIESNVCSTSCDVSMDAACATLDISLVQKLGMESSKLEGEAIPAMDGFFPSDPRCDHSTPRKEAVFLETDDFLAFGKCNLNQLVTESSNGSIEQEPLWNVDVGNQALASLSPWSPKQMCLHQSIVNMRPAYGLAMS